jgi:hypothetical protein
MLCSLNIGIESVLLIVLAKLLLKTIAKTVNGNRSWHLCILYLKRRFAVDPNAVGVVEREHVECRCSAWAMVTSSCRLLDVAITLRLLPLFSTRDNREGRVPDSEHSFAGIGIAEQVIRHETAVWYIVVRSSIFRVALATDIRLWW